MSFGNDNNWNNWKQIRDWCQEKGFKNVAARLELNNDCWQSSGEFGRNQVDICDSIFYAEDEADAMEIAKVWDEGLSENYGLW